MQYTHCQHAIHNYCMTSVVIAVASQQPKHDAAHAVSHEALHLQFTTRQQHCPMNRLSDWIPSQITFILYGCRDTVLITLRFDLMSIDENQASTAPQFCLLPLIARRKHPAASALCQHTKLLSSNLSSIITQKSIRLVLNYILIQQYLTISSEVLHCQHSEEH